MTPTDTTTTVEEWLGTDAAPLDLDPIRALLDARDNALSPSGEHPWLDARLADYVPLLIEELEQARARLAAVAEAVA